jgi:ATP-dependent Lon protease
MKAKIAASDLERTQPMPQAHSSSKDQQKSLQQLDSLCRDPSYWHNIQEIVQKTFQKTAQCLREMSQREENLHAQVQAIRQELRQKADVSDVSQAMSQVVMAVDSRKQIAELQANLNGTKSSINEQKA